MRQLMTKVAVAVLPGAIVLSGCGSQSHQAGKRPTAAASVVTIAAARQVLSGYAATANRASKLRDAKLLATFEGGSSYQIDAGGYRFTRVTDPANNAYAPVTYVNPVFFVPRQHGYPAWFAVRALQQETRKPKKGKQKNLGVYLVFTKASAGAPWAQVLEPNTGGLPSQAPQAVATDSQGYAALAGPAQPGGLAVAPGKLPARDASYLDASSSAPVPPRPGLPAPKPPAGNMLSFANGKKALGDLMDEAFWRKRMPSGSPIRDTHLTTTDPVFAVRTTDGGALVFYDLRASLLLATPFAQLFSVRMPGFFSGKTQARTFTVNYEDQFAVYEPPGARAKPRVVGNYSGPVSGECDGGPCR